LGREAFRQFREVIELGQLDELAHLAFELICLKMFKTFVELLVRRRILLSAPEGRKRTTGRRQVGPMMATGGVAASESESELEEEPA